METKDHDDFLDFMADEALFDADVDETPEANAIALQAINIAYLRDQR